MLGPSLIGVTRWSLRTKGMRIVTDQSVLERATEHNPKALASPATDAVISIQGITKRFGSHTVLEDVTFDVPRGKTSAVLGPSGTGKSVLLKTVIGLLRPEAGQVFIDGDPIVGVREKEVLRIRRKIGVLFQDGALFGSMNLFDNIAFPLVEHTNKTDKEIREIVLAKSELVGLGPISTNSLARFPAVCANEPAWLVHSCSSRRFSSSTSPTRGSTRFASLISTI